MTSFALAAAGLLAGSAIAIPAPAEAQRFHHREYGRHHGWHGPRHGGRAPGYRHRPYRGWRGSRRAGYRGYYGGPRTVCRVHRDQYGATRRCRRVW